MARCTRVLILCLFVAVSLKAFCALEPDQDPTLDVIRREDEEEVDPVYNRETGSLQCDNPESNTNHVTVLSGDPFHLYTKINVQCRMGLKFSNGLTSVNATCFPTPHPCACIVIWDTGPLLMYDFNCTESLHCKNPEADTNKVTVLSGDPYHLYTKVNVQCHEGLKFSNGLASVNTSCFPAPDPCMCVALWESVVANIMYDFNCTESFRCPDRESNTSIVTGISGEWRHLGSEINVECIPGTQFRDGRTSVNASCRPTPHPCMCIGQWLTSVGEDIRVLNCAENQTPREHQVLDDRFNAIGVQLKNDADLQAIEANDKNEINLGTKRRDVEEAASQIKEDSEPGLETNESGLERDEEHAQENKEGQMSNENGEEKTSDQTEEEENEELTNQIEPEAHEEGTEEEEETSDQTEEEENEELTNQIEPEAHEEGTEEEEETSDQTEEEENEELTNQIEPEAHEEGTEEEETHNDVQERPNESEIEETEQEDPEHVKYEEEEEGVNEEEMEPQPIEQPAYHSYNGYEVYSGYESYNKEETEEQEPNTEEVEHETQEEEYENEIHPESEESENGTEEETDETDADSEFEEPERTEETEESQHEEEMTEENQHEEMPEEEELTEEAEENQHEEEENHTEVEPSQQSSNYVEELEEFEPEEDVEDPNYANNYVIDEHETEEGISTYPVEEYEERTNEIEQPNTEFEVPDIFRYHTGRQPSAQIKRPSIILDALLDPLDIYGQEEEESKDLESETETMIDIGDVEAPGWFLDIQLEPVGESPQIAPPPEVGDTCSFPPETGPCRMALWRYYYDSKTKECQRFMYGGCNGNLNNFETLTDCLRKCVKDTHSR